MLKLFSGIDSCFSHNGIPWDNLILDLSDSAAYMRVKSSGVSMHKRNVLPISQSFVLTLEQKNKYISCKYFFVSTKR